MMSNGRSEITKIAFYGVEREEALYPVIVHTFCFRHEKVLDSYSMNLRVYLLHLK